MTRYHLNLWPYGGVDDCRCLCHINPEGAIVITKLHSDGKPVHLQTPGATSFVTGALRRKLNLPDKHPVLFQLEN